MTNTPIKILVSLILFFGGVSFSFGQNTTGTTTELPKTTPKKTTPPATTPTNGVANKPKPGLVPTTTMEGRDALITATDEAAITAEETRRLTLEAELEADEARAAIRKRVFGSNMFANSTFDFTQAINIATPNNYVLGPGDKITLNIHGISQEEIITTVRPDGFIVLEKSGLVNVIGLPIEEAQAKIKSALARKYPGLGGNNPNTFLRLTLSGYKSIKVNVRGEVIAPGTYTLTSFSTVMHALYSSGGPNEIGTFRQIHLIRGNRAIATIDLYDYLVNGYSKADFFLKDQDIVHVGPFVSRTAVSGNLKRSGLFEILPNETIADLIKYAGGFNQYAFSDILKLYRNTSNERKIVNVEKGAFNKELVNSGDSLVVERVLDRFENMVTIEGAVFRPGEYSLDSNPTVLALVKSAQGLREESLEGRINVFRTNSDLTVSNITLNLRDIELDKSLDQKLQRLDRVVVPSIFELTEKAYIRIQGAINNPDAKTGVELPYVKNMTIEDVITQVGGLTEAASLTNVLVSRRKRVIDPTQADAQISEVRNYTLSKDFDWVSGGHSDKLEPFDEIIVRTSPNYEKQGFVKVTGEVLYPGLIPIMYKNDKISDIIARAGGINQSLAYPKGATFIRQTALTERQRARREESMANQNVSAKIKSAEAVDETTEGPITAREVDIAAILPTEIGIELDLILRNPNNDEINVTVQDGDEIFIPKRLETVRIEGEVLYPTSVKFNPSMRFLDYVSQSGGFTKKSARASAYVQYPNGKIDRTRKFLFARFHPKIEPGSEIVVPQKMATTAEQFNQFSGLIATISGTLGTIVTIIGLIRFTR